MTAHIYVDGSYRNTEKVGWAYACVENDDVKYLESGALIGDQYTALRQVTGEIFAAIKAVDYAVENGFKKIVIYYDYEGVKAWITGEWKAKKELTRKYRDIMKKFIKEKNIDIQFVKSPAHEGFNKVVDEAAKAEAL